MSIEENWNDSRWEFTKRRSRWHFDTTRYPEPGIDSYTNVCRFDIDFTDAIAICMPKAKTGSWADRGSVNKNRYSLNAEEQDLIRAGADVNAPVFMRTEANDVEIFQKINSWLGLNDSTIKFHNQKTGQLLHTHIDNFGHRAERENSFKETEIDRNPEIMRRFVIMLADWQLGQIFQIGNANFTQWTAGDCITWEWQDMPHSTANMGWWDRPILQITGYVTKRTHEVLRNANKNLIVKI